eukprot:jgi/Mesen1/1357/ME000013S00850
MATLYFVLAIFFLWGPSHALAARSVPGLDAPLSPGVVNGTLLLRKALHKIEDGKNYQTFLSLLKESGIVSFLEQHLTEGKQATILVPEDRAFEMYPPASIAELRQNPSKLKALLLFHIIPTYQTFLQLAQRKAGHQFKSMTASQMALEKRHHNKFSTVVLGPPGAIEMDRLAMVVHANLVTLNHLAAHSVSRVLIPLVH